MTDTSQSLFIKKNHIQRAARNFCSTNLTSNYSKYFGPDSFRLLRKKLVSFHQMLFAFFISSYGAFLMESDVGSSLRKDKFWIFWLATIKWAWDLRCRSRCPWSRSKFSYNPVVQQKMFLLNILYIKKKTEFKFLENLMTALASIDWLETILK